MRDKKSEKRVVLFAAIEPTQHEALRYIAFIEKRSIADITREAIGKYVAEKSEEHPIGAVEPQLVETVKVSAAGS